MGKQPVSRELFDGELQRLAALHCEIENNRDEVHQAIRVIEEIDVDERFEVACFTAAGVLRRLSRSLARKAEYQRLVRERFIEQHEPIDRKAVKP